MHINTIWIFTALLLLNLRMLYLLFQDKHIAQHKKPMFGFGADSKQETARIPEVSLLYNAIFFASFGAVLGMFLFRHKIRKFYFLSSFIFLAIMHLSLLFLAMKYLESNYDVAFVFNIKTR